MKPMNKKMKQPAIQVKTQDEQVYKSDLGFVCAQLLAREWTRESRTFKSRLLRSKIARKVLGRFEWYGKWCQNYAEEYHLVMSLRAGAAAMRQGLPLPGAP